MMSGLWLSVRSLSVVTCSGVSMLPSMLASVEGADEEVCRVGGSWIGLDITTEKQCGVSKER